MTDDQNHQFTEQEDAAAEVAANLFVAALDPATVIKALAEADTYRAIVVVLLDEQPEADEALQYLRGLGRIGILSKDKDTAGENLHRRVMATLAAKGVEPLSEEEVLTGLRAGIGHMLSHSMAPQPEGLA